MERGVRVPAFMRGISAGIGKTKPELKTWMLLEWSAGRIAARWDSASRNKSCSEAAHALGSLYSSEQTYREGFVSALAWRAPSDEARQSQKSRPGCCFDGHRGVSQRGGEHREEQG